MPPKVPKVMSTTGIPFLQYYNNNNIGIGSTSPVKQMYCYQESTEQVPI